MAVTAPGTTQDIDAALYTPGTISGDVTVNGSPLPGQATASLAAAYNSSGQAAGTECTDDLGDYTIADLPPGSYRIGFDTDGQCFGGSPNSYFGQYYNNSATLAGATSLNLAEGGAISGIDAQMVVGAEISGAVTDAFGDLLGDVEVELLQTDGTVVSSKCTAGNGYWFSPIPAGTYEVEFDPTGSACSSSYGSYFAQYYHGASTLGGGTPITLSLGGFAGDTSAVLVTSEAVPVSGSAPTITGTAQVGEMLNASEGGWSSNAVQYRYQWEDCANSHCNPISGATNSSYQVSDRDAGSTIEVAVTAIDLGGSSAPASSIPTALVPPAPVNITLPTNSGSTVVGDVLTEQHGTWSVAPTSYSYQWEDCCWHDVPSDRGGGRPDLRDPVDADANVTIVVVETVYDGAPRQVSEQCRRPSGLSRCRRRVGRFRVGAPLTPFVPHSGVTLPTIATAYSVASFCAAAVSRTGDGLRHLHRRGRLRPECKPERERDLGRRQADRRQREGEAAKANQEAHRWQRRGQRPSPRDRDPHGSAQRCRAGAGARAPLAGRSA